MIYFPLYFNCLFFLKFLPGFLMLITHLSHTKCAFLSLSGSSFISVSSLFDWYVSVNNKKTKFLTALSQDNLLCIWLFSVYVCVFVCLYMLVYMCEFMPTCCTSLCVHRGQKGAFVSFVIPCPFLWGWVSPWTETFVLFSQKAPVILHGAGIMDM